MKRTHYPFLIIAALFLLLRLINITSVYLWYDEIDIIWNTFGSNNSWTTVFETSFNNVTQTSSSPWFPIFILHALIKLFGHYMFAIHLPSLIFSLASLYFLNLILANLFSNPYSRSVPLLLFTFSIPSIIYSQSPQPIICYFLSTTIQTYFFIRIIKRGRGTVSSNYISRSLQLLTRVSLVAFLFNWMSVVIHLLFTAYFIAFVAGKSKNKHFRRIAFTVGEAIVDFIPLGIIAYLRFRMGMHRVIYEVGNLNDLLRLTYDFLAYHFNYAYTVSLYKPLSFNPISLPYIALFGIGIACFIIFKKNHRIPVLITGFAFLTGVYFNLMPFGGIRHSFTIAPFAYIFAGYGIEYLRSAIPHLHLPLSVFRKTVAGIIVIMLLTFLVSGTQLYSKRKSTLVLDNIIEMALKNNVEMIAGLNDTYRILLIMDNTAGKPLGKQDLRLVDYRPPMNTALKEPYILISYRCAFNPDFGKNVKWPAEISLKQFKNLKITPIKEVIGPLKPKTDIMVHQSIYYPLNGCFVYLIEPTGRQ